MAVCRAKFGMVAKRMVGWWVGGIVGWAGAVGAAGGAEGGGGAAEGQRRLGLLRGSVTGGAGGA